MIVTQLYAFNQMNSLKGRVQNTEAKWNSRMPIFYIWLLCHVFFCFVLCVGGVCTWILGICDETGLWRWRVRSWNGLWETGSLSRYWKLPGHIPGPDLETCLTESSWLFPQIFPSVIMKKKKEDHCDEHKVHSLPISIGCSTHGTNFSRMQCSGLIQLGKDHKTPLQTLV